MNALKTTIRWASSIFLYRMQIAVKGVKLLWKLLCMTEGGIIQVTSNMMVIMRAKVALKILLDFVPPGGFVGFGQWICVPSSESAVEQEGRF